MKTGGGGFVVFSLETTIFGTHPVSIKDLKFLGKNTFSSHFDVVVVVVFDERFNRIERIVVVFDVFFLYFEIAST